MLIHWQNSQALRSKQDTARRETQSRELVKLPRKDPVICQTLRMELRMGVPADMFSEKNCCYASH
jgi:hypothetical protein